VKSQFSWNSKRTKAKCHSAKSSEQTATPLYASHILSVRLSTYTRRCAQKMTRIKVYVCGVSGCAREDLDKEIKYCKRVIQNAKSGTVLSAIKHEYHWLRVATTTRTPLNAIALIEPPPEEFEVIKEVGDECFLHDEATIELQRVIYDRGYKEMGGEEKAQ